MVEEVTEHHHNLRATSFMSSKEGERPTSAASVSDADSGISDTEDEDKPTKVLPKEPASVIETEPTSQQTGVVESPVVPAPISEPPAVTEEIQGPKIEEAPTAVAEDTVPDALQVTGSLETVKNEETTDHQTLDSPTEETAVAETKPEHEEKAPLPELNAEVSAETPAFISAQVEESARDVVADKKRPLEEDDDDDEDADHSPDAKQPRIFSPDKVFIA